MNADSAVSERSPLSFTARSNPSGSARRRDSIDSDSEQTALVDASLPKGVSVSFDSHQLCNSCSLCVCTPTQRSKEGHPLADLGTIQAESTESLSTIDTGTNGSTYSVLCRICQSPEWAPESNLIAPCRCAGSMKFVHQSCLQKWIEVSYNKSCRLAQCEFCHYSYRISKQWAANKRWQWPQCTRRDKCLHMIFLITVLLMIGCAAATIFCFMADREHLAKLTSRNKLHLTREEIVTLSCGILFFVSFFVAMYVQVKAKHTIYQLIVHLITDNQRLRIQEYDSKKDADQPKRNVLLV